MSKLNQGELLDIFDGVFSFYLGELGHEEDKVKIEQAKKQIVALIKKPEVTEEWIEEKMKESINKSFKDYETEIQAILFVDPINKSSYRKINKATDALVDHIWDSIRSLVKEIRGKF